MVFLIPAAILLLIAIVFLAYRYRLLKDKVKELDDKTRLVLDSDEALQKISFQQENELKQLADTFNMISSKYHQLKLENENLAEAQTKGQELDQELNKFKEALSQIDLLTGIGKQITSSLAIEDILRVSFENIRASMDLHEMQILFHKEDQPVFVLVKERDDIQYAEKGSGLVSEEILKWTCTNNKEASLVEASKNYQQYVFQPLQFQDGLAMESVMVFPLSLKGAAIGSILVGSPGKKAFEAHHAEFIRTLTSYMAVAIDNCNIYQLLDEGKKVIEEEREKSEKLLLNILPAEIAEELKQEGQAKARDFETVHVLFTDFSGFTEYASQVSAGELVHELNESFSAFDRICAEYGIEKIKTIGDAYMAAGGLSGDPDSAEKTVKAALAMRDFIQERIKEKQLKDELNLGIRIGIHSGPLVAGIVGLQKFQYDLWGDTVNTASRMESLGAVGKVNISSACHQLIKDNKNFSFEARGEKEVKGKGMMTMHYVDRA